LPIAILLILLLGSFLGSINGFLTAYVRIPSFITTLAGMSAYRGMAFMFNKGSPVFSISDSLDILFYGKLLGIPMPFFYVVFFFALASFVMRYARLGRRIYAVGGNAAAAQLSGINVKRTQLLAFLIAGFMAATQFRFAQLRGWNGIESHRRGGYRRRKFNRRQRQYSFHAIWSAHDCDRPKRFESKCGTYFIAEYHYRFDYTSRSGD
jgi:ABC-type xylose transport system permease subunit